MRRRSLFRGLLAAPAFIFAKPAQPVASEDEQAAALRMIDEYAARTFGRVTDGVKRAYQRYLIDGHGHEIQAGTAGRPRSVVTKVNQLFDMDGENKPGVPDVLAKSLIAWIHNTLGGEFMERSPTSILCWRRRPDFDPSGPDFENDNPGGLLRIRARAHSWDEYQSFRGAA